MRKLTNQIVGFCFFMIVGGALLVTVRTLAIGISDQPITPIQIPEQEIITDDDPDDDYANPDEFLNARYDLAVEVENYIRGIAPTASVNPYVLIDKCSEYDIDLFFVMAQGHLESHFATKGTAKRTNSIFNVGAYDGHSANRQCRNGFGFEDPNDSIEPYLKLIKSDYLVEGKTELDLMSNYVNYLGMRYASNKKYEMQLRSIYNRISSNVNLQDAYIRYLTHESYLNS